MNKWKNALATCSAFVLQQMDDHFLVCFVHTTWQVELHNDIQATLCRCHKVSHGELSVPLTSFPEVLVNVKGTLSASNSFG